MDTATKPAPYDWAAYGQRRAQVTVRMDRAEKEMLDAALRNRGESFSDLVMAYLRPIITEGTPDGQRAHQIISAAVQESIAWNKANTNGGFGDTEAVRNEQGEPTVEEWRSPDIIVRPRMTKGGDRVLYHVVTQGAGMTRHDAIRRHVATLMDVWADIPEHAEDGRESFLRELADPDRHRFIIAYSNFNHWTRFDATHEMQLHFTVHQMPYISQAANDDETAFVAWATAQVSEGWTRRKRSKSDVVTIREGQRDEDSTLLIGHDFRNYAIRSDAENIAAWAGVWLNHYRQLRRGGIAHDTAMGIIQNERVRIIMMRFTEA